MNFAPEPNTTPKPRARKIALSPVGETIGEAMNLKHHVDNQRVRSETAFEVGSNY